MTNHTDSSTFGKTNQSPSIEDVAGLVDMAIVAPSNGHGPTHDEAQPPVTPDLPQIIVTNRPMPGITNEAIAALQLANNPPALFVRSGALARVRTDEKGRPLIDDADAAVLRGKMARAALWYKRVKFSREFELRHIPPPEEIVKDALALGSWPEFPALDAITETPALRSDGTILDQPGYDPMTGLFYVPAKGFLPPSIPHIPTTHDLAAAVDLIDETIGDFPYADEASRANAWGLLLTPVLRPAIVGNTPLALIDKPQAGTGASLLAEAVSILATGRQAAMMTAPDDDEEWRKKITAALSEGATVVTIDNLEAPLQSANLAAVLTSSTWQDRILGRSATVTLSQRATWLATGNNIKLGGDMPRRCYWIRLDAQMAQPWRRHEFRHPGLIGWVQSNRGAILGALLTIARAWWAAGCPVAADAPSLGSFEGWARTIAGVLAHAGVPGFLGNLDDLYERVDEEGQQWQGFLAVWHAMLSERSITAADLIRRLKDGLGKGEAKSEQMDLDQAITAEEHRANTTLAEALPDSLVDDLNDPKRAAGFSRRLGKALAKRADMTFANGFRLIKDAPQEGKATAKWYVKRVSTGV